MDTKDYTLKAAQRQIVPAYVGTATAYRRETVTIPASDPVDTETGHTAYLLAHNEALDNHKAYNSDITG